MKKTFILLSFICSFQCVIAQDWHELSSLQKQLKASHADTGRINILLRMAEFETFKPGEYKKDLDSAAEYIRQAENLNHSIKSKRAAAYITIEQSYLAKDHNDRKTGQLLMEKALHQLEENGDKYLLGKVYLGLSEYRDVDSTAGLQARINLVQKAADVYESGGFIEREAFCYKNLADLIDDIDVSFKKANKALQLYLSINYKQLQGVYDQLAQYYIVKNDYQPALKYDLVALKTAKQQNDVSSTLIEIENHVGIIYDRLNDYENGVKYFTMAISTAKLIGDNQAFVNLTLNVADLHIRTKQVLKAREILKTLPQKDIQNTTLFNKLFYYKCYLRVFTGLKEFNRAQQLSVIFKSLILSGESDPRNQATCYNTLTGYYLASKQYGEARKVLLQNDRIIKGLSSPFYLEISSRLWMELDTALHDYKAAVYHALLQRKFSDSLYMLSKSKAIQELQVQFDTKEKESQITFFKQKAFLESKNLQQANIVKDYTIGGSVLLIIIAGLLYRQNFIKQRSSAIISNKNALLQNLLTEKEWLLKEVHHRVKNNLHTVICLLESQAAYLENDALMAIENSQHRIYAMSLIHQKLYQTDAIETLDMPAYIKDFLNYLKDAFGQTDRIQIHADVESFSLGAAQAIPLGLIINEAVTNAYKYAFPANRKGIINISLHQSADLVELLIIDNGIGMKVLDEFEDSPSLGMQLIKGLTRDLKGQLKIDGSKGTSIRILFEINIFDKPVSGLNIAVPG